MTARILDLGAGRGSKDRYQRALEAVRAELEAIPIDDLPTIEIDVPTAVTHVFGASAPLRELLPVARRLVELDVRLLENLETYAMALARAHAAFVSDCPTPSRVAPLSDELARLRESLAGHIQAMESDLVDTNVLQRLRGGDDPNDIARDVGVLLLVLEESWPRIEGHTLLTRDQLKNGQRRLQELHGELARVGRPAESEASVLRRRALFVFMRAYDQARRAIMYLRWNRGGADAILPALVEGVVAKKRRRRR